MLEYQALYRKWRPSTFDDVIGQRHVTDTIKNEVKNDACGHAFLFCGSRGTGKTSTARIFSRAINCENPVDGNPCNNCETCKGILNGSIMDIVEIDAASNSGVENIRTLRDEANYTAAITKYKVYIIDEVHALSKEAFNALLKLLEEPPVHVKFVLATTEANKVLETISSRCQRFDFKRITSEDIFERLDYVCNAEGIIAEEKALRMIAAAADGSLRDALSCLEPCIAAGKEVDTEFVAEFLGKAENDALLEVCSAIANNNAKDILACIDSVCKRGKNLSPFIESLIKAIRDMLIISVVGKCKSDFEDTEYSALEKYAAMISSEKLIYAIKSLSEAVSSARFMTNPRVIFEATLVKLCMRGNDGSTEALLARIAELERKIENGNINISSEKIQDIKKVEQPVEVKRKITELPPNETVNRIKEIWPEVMNDISGSITLFAVLENVSLCSDEGKLAFVFPDEGGREMLTMLKSGMDDIKASIRRHSGLDLEIVTGTESDFTHTSSINNDDPIEQIINLPITEIY